MPSWVYILRCSDDSYYTGCTTNLEQRFGQHLAGEIPGYTATRRPLEMVWAQECQDVLDAINAERQIKGWSRAKKEALIAQDWDRLSSLAKRGFRPMAEKGD